MSNLYPQHRRLSSEKDDSYYKEMGDYYINQANLLSAEKEELQTLYDAAQGIIDTKTYSYVLNPYNTENEKLKRFPAKLRNYDIIQPIVRLFMGERAGMKDDVTITVTNADAVNKKTESLNDGYLAVFAQDFINNLNEAGVDTGVPNKEVDYEAFRKKHESTYMDNRANVGQEAMNYLKANLDHDELVQEAFYDFFVTGRCFTFKDVYLDDVYYEVVDPRDIYVIGGSNQKFVEDADAIVCLRRMTANMIVDRFWENLSEDDLDWLQTKAGDGVTNDLLTLRSENIDKGSESATTFDDDDYLNVYHVSFKAYKKVGILNYLHPVTGEPEKIEVDDTYKLNKAGGDIDIEWFWVNQIEQLYVIEDELYLEAGPIDVQRAELNNMSICKHAYNGRIWGYRESAVNSIVKQLLPYEVLHNIFHYRWEMAIAKSKDKALMFPLSLIPNKAGWDEDKFMYWITSQGFGLYDDTAPNAKWALQGIKEIDLSFGRYAAEMWAFIQNIKSEAWDVVGLNRQRYGATMASEGKAVTEQAIYQSSVITKDIYRQFAKLLESDWDGLLDYSKVAWIDGKKASYITSDKRRAFFEVNGIEHMETEYGIFASVGADEAEKLSQAKSLLQTMGQNGLPPDAMISILDANNVSKVLELAKQGMEAERNFQASMQEAQSKAAQGIQEQISADKAQEVETKKYVADMQYKGVVDAAKIKANVDLVGLYNDTANEMETNYADDSGANNSNDSRREALQGLANERKTLHERDKMDLDKEKMRSQERIAKENRNRYDK